MGTGGHASASGAEGSVGGGFMHLSFFFFLRPLFTGVLTSQALWPAPISLHSDHSLWYHGPLLQMRGLEGAG